MMLKVHLGVDAKKMAVERKQLLKKKQLGELKTKKSSGEYFHEERAMQERLIEIYLKQEKDNKNFTDQLSRASEHCRVLSLMIQINLM